MASAAASAILECTMNAASSSSSKVKLWSLNSLARIKRDMIDTSSSTSRILAPPVLELARDVAFRLGEQKSHVEHMENYVKDRLQEDQHQQSQRPNHQAPRQNNNNGVICTSNFSQPYWWKQQQQQPKSTEYWHERQQALKKARQNLTNLKMLHENTQEIAETFWHHLEHKDDVVLNKREQKWLKAAFRQIRDRHALTVENLAEFCITTRPYWNVDGGVDDTVMNFLRGRLGVQLLCEHALAPNVDGVISVNCHLPSVLEDAINEAKLLCESNYSHLVTAAPEVVIVSQTLDQQNQFTIVRPWVHYVLVELLKNAMAVSMERMTHDETTCNKLPPTIYIAIDDHHLHTDDPLKSYLSIDVLDQGGGFAKKNPALAQNTDVLFDFVRTKKTMWDRLDDQQTYAMTRSPMQGLGVGLCLSRLMMQHFGGTVELMSHPPLSLQQEQSFAGLSGDLESGCVASIRLSKDLHHPEQLYDV